uniref:Uncharacterized protein n=1 Tax=Anguilla anguilla TaxID=7936 RepID=A0A0E9RB74_ANGAN
MLCLINKYPFLLLVFMIFSPPQNFVIIKLCFHSIYHCM